MTRLALLAIIKFLRKAVIVCVPIHRTKETTGIARNQMRQFLVTVREPELKTEEGYVADIYPWTDI